MMNSAGGYESLTFRSAWPTPDEFTSNHYPRTFWEFDAPEEILYLFGPKEARDELGRLCRDVILDLPATEDGIQQALPQQSPIAQWFDFVDRRFWTESERKIFEPRDELFVVTKQRGKSYEQRFKDELVTINGLTGTGFPEANKIPKSALRWRVSILVHCPFATSVRAIDRVLETGCGKIVSLDEADKWADQTNARMDDGVIELLKFADRQIVPITIGSCKPVSRDTPSLCPQAVPPHNGKQRDGLIHHLPEIEKLYRDNKFIEDGETIHWVGAQATSQTICRCDFNSVESTGADESAGTDNERWEFYPTGDGYQIAGFGESGFLSKSLGLDNIYKLVQKPNTLIPMLKLEDQNASESSEKWSKQPTLDEEAKREFFARLRELDDELAEAERNDNADRIEAIQHERDVFRQELVGAAGLRGKSRDMNNFFDNLRLIVL